MTRRREYTQREIALVAVRRVLQDAYNGLRERGQLVNPPADRRNRKPAQARQAS